MDEFDLIARIQSATEGLQPIAGSLAMPGDDCAVMQLAAGKELVVSSDLYIAGVHFPANLDGADIARHCLSGAISDLAAMGASPLAMTLAVSAHAASWIEALIPGCTDVIKDYRIALVGGDLSQGPESLSVTVIGQIAEKTALKRSDAEAGDDLWISGCLGEAAAGLRLLMAADEGGALPAKYRDLLIKRFTAPEARIDLGLALVGIASAAIDISDGLLADLGHLLKASKLGARLFPDAIPVSGALKVFADTYPAQTAMDFILQGGDDYELCFTAPAKWRNRIEETASRFDFLLSRIGTIEADPGLRWPDNFAAPAAGGYRHSFL